ncbi:SGNH/GDSL hydrolase family protein [Leifsonia sp. NPDC102414]|uniref:SGNH/GDSL hydrolase family protein n=1 Tax=unclassified Leifsonia TaxID=2663824 RepID=UPI000A5C9E69|nr:SGNH/GDSL hydrolase family protein [Leifsonia sp. Root227]
MFARPITRIAAVTVATIVIAVTAGCTSLAGGTTFTGAPEATPTPQATSSAPVRAAAIGDSIAIGNGVPYDDAWPFLVADQFGWTLNDFADSASGFIAPGLNTHTYEAQVSQAIALRPQVVIIAATRNDTLGSTIELKNTATAQLQRLRTALPDAVIIGVGPIWGAGTPTPATPVVASIVRSAVLAVDGTWVDVGQPFQNRADLVQKDNVHPTADGQHLLAGLIADKIAAARITTKTDTAVSR